MSSPAPSPWHVLPHGPLEKLADNLWWVQGSLRGMSLKRAMTVVKRNDGKLLIHNAIALSEDGMRALEALGEPAELIVPSRIHRLDAPAYKERYPRLRVYVPRGGRKDIERLVAVDGVFEDFPSDEVVRFEMLHGVRDQEGAMIVTSPDGTTLVLNDVVFNMDRKRDVLGYLFTTIMGSAPGPRVSRLAKLWLIDDQKALRADLERLARLPALVRLVVAHEKVAHGPEAATSLLTAASYLR